MKILLADDHPLMREGIRQALSQLGASTEIFVASDYPGLFAQTALHPDLDLALVDLNMPGFTGIQGITQYRNRHPDIPLVVLSASEAPALIRSVLGAGALGYIPKSASADWMLAALRQVLSGYPCAPPDLSQNAVAPHTPDPTVLKAFHHQSLTTRQLDVARLLVQGCANKAIGGMLSMSENTVKVHMAAIFRALSVPNRTAAVLEIQRLMQIP